MKKLFKNEKGFTLVELMVVIAIIGLLAAVLVPKMGFMKDTAKEAGLDSNMRLVEATVTSMLPKYKVSEISSFRSDLADKLDGNLTNPFSNSSVADIGDGNTTGQPAVVVYNGPYVDWPNGDPFNDVAGAIICAVTESHGHIKVEIGYLDKDGNALSSTKTRIVE